MKKHLVIPDVQCSADNDYSYLKIIGAYIAEKRPDTIVCLGDFADMNSLSSYDVGKKVFEGRRYRTDIDVAKDAMNTLLQPVRAIQTSALKHKKKQYNPKMILTLGNHEERINTAVNNDPKLDGTISIDDLGYSEAGWEVYPYKEVVLADGIAYSHVFCSGVMQRPVSSARALLQKKHMSAIQGHVQKMEIYNEYRADGHMLTGLFAGCCYLHNEEYLGAQGNNYFRGIHMLYDVDDGQFHCHSITLDYLINRYNKKNKDGS